MVCMIVVDLAQLLVPQVVKTAVDTLAEGAAGGAGLDRSVLAAQCLFIIILGIGMAVLRYGWRMLLMGSARGLEKGLRNHLFRHVLSLDPAFFDRVKTGDIMAHATSDINHVRMAFGFGFIVIVDTLLLGGAILGIMIWTDPKLTAMALVPMPLLVWFTKHLGQKMHDFHTTAQESFSALTELVRESFFGIRVIKVFNFEDRAKNRVENASKDYFNKNLKRAVVTALLRPLLAMFFNISSLIIVFYGGYLVMESKLTPGELVAFLQYLGLLAWPIIAIGWMTNLFQRGRASLKRIEKLLDARPDVEGPVDPVPDFIPKGRITFQNTSFGYTPEKEAPKDILTDITLEIRQGRSLGITGPPGSGKTSLVQLIPRLYNPTRGAVFLDGHPLQNLEPEQVRSGVAFMPQEPFLFSGTIRENILMGRDMDDTALNRVIRACELEQTLADMPDGLETVVGERGVTLSGGQKQRVALARTLAEPKPIVILDDPVSQLDTRTAQSVIAAMTRMNPGATHIIISHRLSALAGCDEILVLDRGKIQALDTHEELLETNAFYRESFRVQQFEEAHGS